MKYTINIQIVSLRQNIHMLMALNYVMCANILPSKFQIAFKYDQFNHNNRVSLQSQYNFKMFYITQAVYTQKFSMVSVQILSRFTVIPLL